MRNLYTTDKWFEDLFGLHRGFNEMFNRALAARPWGRELPEFTNAFTFAPAVEAYIDKEGKKYVCRVTLPGVEPKDLQIHAQGNLLTIRGERKITHKEKEAEFFEEDVNTRMTAVLSLIEPAIMIVMGGFVAFVLIALYLPIFSLADTIR